MPLDKKITEDQALALETALQKMAVLCQNSRMSEDQLDEYCDDLVDYHAFTYSFDRLMEAIKKARQKFVEPGKNIPKVGYIMSMIKPESIR